MSKLLALYYSMYGHVETLGHAVAEPGEFACDDSMSTLILIEARSLRKPVGKFSMSTRS